MPLLKNQVRPCTKKKNRYLHQCSINNNMKLVLQECMLISQENTSVRGMRCELRCESSSSIVLEVGVVRSGT